MSTCWQSSGGGGTLTPAPRARVSVQGWGAAEPAPPTPEQTTLSTAEHPETPPPGQQKAHYKNNNLYSTNSTIRHTIQIEQSIAPLLIEWGRKNRLKIVRSFVFGICHPHPRGSWRFVFKGFRRTNTLPRQRNPPKILLWSDPPQDCRTVWFYLRKNRNYGGERQQKKRTAGRARIDKKTCIFTVLS